MLEERGFAPTENPDKDFMQLQNKAADYIEKQKKRWAADEAGIVVETKPSSKSYVLKGEEGEDVADIEVDTSELEQKNTKAA